MLLRFEDRRSDSPFVERVWRARSERGGLFVSVAVANFEMAVTRHRGRTFLTLRGPETKATVADCPADGEWLGIRFKLGTFMPRLMPEALRDHNDVTLPDASSRSFWLDGSAWSTRLRERRGVRGKVGAEGLLTRDPAVDTVMHHEQPAESVRTVQRHFLRATGPTRRAVRQIERARQATILLRQGVPSWMLCTTLVTSIRRTSRDRSST